VKRHSMPFADSVLWDTKPNPHYTPHSRYYGSKYVKVWKPGAIETLTRLSASGDDLLVSVEAEAKIRDHDDFDSSDLVIGKRDTWYSIVKYRPSKAAARRKGRDTILNKEKQASDRDRYVVKLRAAAAVAYNGLRVELDRFGIDDVIVVVKEVNPDYHYYNANDQSDHRKNVRMVKALLPLHAAFLGKNAHRHNDAWQEFLGVVRDRPKDLRTEDYDNGWGNYSDVREWLEDECKIKKPKPTQRMLRAKAKADAEELLGRTCVRCGHVADKTSNLSRPPRGCKTEYAAGDKLCLTCWEIEHDAATEPVRSDVEAVASGR